MKPILLSALVIVWLSAHAHAGMLPQEVEDEDYRPLSTDTQDEDAKIELGRLLFFDRILSGNKNISCATCHHPLTSTGDSLSLPIGEGGNGLGPGRDTGLGDDRVEERAPRNSPALFNLGAKEFRVIFHDGRLKECPSRPSGFCSPAGDHLPLGLDNVLAAQAMFPVTSATEMAGQEGENAIADLAVAGDLLGLWGELAMRLQAIPEYCDLFADAYGLACDEVTYMDAANAIAAFEAASWRSDDSPFDRFLRMEPEALGDEQADAFQGMRLFYGKARCARCHVGKFQTDHAFHAIGAPQIGPGKGDGMTGREDFGRERVTGEWRDRFKFRTPTLRNVALTGPYGHAGAHATLSAMIRHHIDPESGLFDYDRTQAVLPSRPDLDAIDFSLFDEPGQPAIVDIANAVRPNLMPKNLTDREINQLVAFLEALTGDGSQDLRDDIPDRVPSGLPVNEEPASQ